MSVEVNCKKDDMQSQYIHLQVVAKKKKKFCVKLAFYNEITSSLLYLCISVDPGIHNYQYNLLAAIIIINSN